MRFSGTTILRSVATLAFLSALLLVATTPTSAQTETLLYNFCSQLGCADGEYPYAGLIVDTKGNLYGTTYEGGANGVGTVFKLSANGTETVLHSFANNGTDGYNPVAGLLRDAKGNLYGTTQSGGANGVGTVFKISAKGIETVLYSFASGTDGAYPYTGVIMDKSGNLYGTTQLGGVNNMGTVFKLSANGTETLLHSFAEDGGDGFWPFGELIMDKSGNLYGTTAQGGANSAGMVFKLGTDETETILYSFAGGSDGAYPYAGMIMDAKGNLYGTTVQGGENNAGTLFAFSAKQTERVLHFFPTYGGDGEYPRAVLIRDKKGNLYGTTYGGGAYGEGTVFELSAKGIETVLHSFANNGTDGYNPYAGLVMDKSGNLYGTTVSGGIGGGVVFKVVP